MITYIDINAGSDFLFPITWPDGAGGNANLSNYDVELYEVHASLTGQLTVNFVDASAGTINVLYRWTPDMPKDGGATFRVRLVPKTGFPNLLKMATNKLAIRVE